MPNEKDRVYIHLEVQRGRIAISCRTVKVERLLSLHKRTAFPLIGYTPQLAVVTTEIRYTPALR